MRKLLSLAILVLFAIGASAQSSTGILDPSRAIDWSKAGVVGGIPDESWTQCGSTIAAGASAATIQTAINSCGTNQYVLLGAGTFNLSTGLTMNKSNVVLRGMGANQTFLTFSGVVGCYYGGAAICFSSDYDTYGNDDTYSKPGQTQAANWTAGYSQGATSITVANVGSNGILNGQYIYLNEADDATIGSGLFNCDLTSPACAIEGGSPGQTVNGVDYSQVQIVKVTAGCSTKCTGAGPFTLTITPGLYGTNWSSGKSPYVWWPNSEVQYAGVENMSLDLGPSGIGDNGSTINFMNSFNCWVSGVRGLHGGRAHVWFWQAAHDQVQNSYFYQTQDAQSQSYGVEEDLSSDNLVVNNIMQQVTAPLMGGSQFGNSFAYNYMINNYQTASANCMYPAEIAHDAASEYNLWEGNFSNNVEADIVHGSSGLNTVFRNVFTGYELGKSCTTVGVFIDPYNRYENVVGNVIGTPGVTQYYSDISNPTQGAEEEYMVYILNQPHGSISGDPLVSQTLFRWGNYDTVTGAVRWCGNSSDTGWATTCGSKSEVPTGISSYSNAVPSYGDTGAGQSAMSASFIYSSTPSWWPSGKPWPPIGPDVTNGNLGQCGGGSYASLFGTASGQCTGGTLSAQTNGGHANSLPAMDCYFSLGGPPDGSGNALSFNASQCYGNSGTTGGGSGGGGTPPTAPTGLTATVN
ncbi:MAG TPA: hypothetical protein VMG82_05055 [Candidatus Sulfotelmatobacter sp.]|nr:hypothetical protein [Candidatus Sulfotelmatobacter sp.]